MSMTHEFKQRVMAAAGVKPRKAFCMCDGQECRANCRAEAVIYPDPEREGFLPLWNAVIAKGINTDYVHVRGVSACHHWTLFFQDGSLASTYRGHDRAIALIRAAAQALGVQE